ncbi:MAG TPA: TylF/MycF/NovP-related O-methyltransferase [Aeromicrobium sp.]|nr:TylF/MycF/NovP-related O-methyltransferase [Aeromicrobium sp.]
MNPIALSVQRKVQAGLKRRGYELRRVTLSHFDPPTAATIEAVAPYTLTSPERVAATCEAVRYITRYGIPGAIVECGVWRGGNSLAAARTLLELDVTDRDLYLFDTFEGMTKPGDEDRDHDGNQAAEMIRAGVVDEDWCAAPLDDVRATLRTVAYPEGRIHLIPGRVEDTIPGKAPDQIALLRLDTDWYESTRHELEHLIDRLSDNGILIIDDYGHWEGARKAVDEWLATFDRPVFLARTDYTGRIATVGPAPALS